jgi:hypothetical protein
MKQSVSSILSEETIKGLKTALEATDNEKLVDTLSLLMETNSYRRKFSHANLAEVIGESDQTTGYMMRGRRKMSVKDLACISVFFGISMDSLVFGDSYNSAIEQKMLALESEIKGKEEQLKKADMLNMLLMEKIDK